MKLFVLGAALLVVTSALAAENGSFSPQAKTGTAVDDFMEKLGGQIPFPPEKIVTTLEAKGIPVYGSTIIPFGRSLERRFTSYAQPRSIVSFYFGKQPLEVEQRVDASKFVFVAYTPGNNQLQIIGGSDSLPNGFFVVRDYREGNTNAQPQAPAQIGLCLACHQNGGPIFSGAPWNETTHELRHDKLESQPHLDPFAKWLLKKYLDADDSGAGEIDHGTEDLDFSVRAAAEGVCSIRCFENRRKDPKRASSLLEDRAPDEPAYQIEPSGDPLMPRLGDVSPFTSGTDEVFKGLDPFAEPSPSWTISLARDGNQSHPQIQTQGLFAMYCSSCHAGADADAPQLPLHNLTALKSYVGNAKRTVRGLLESKLMPPIGSYLPSAEDRARMVQALNGD